MYVHMLGVPTYVQYIRLTLFEFDELLVCVWECVSVCGSDDLVCTYVCTYTLPGVVVCTYVRTYVTSAMNKWTTYPCLIVWPSI